MLDVVTQKEITAILEVTDALGVHREMVVIPLGTRTPGSVAKRRDGKLEIVVDRERPFEAWLAELSGRLSAVLG